MGFFRRGSRSDPCAESLARSVPTTATVALARCTTGTSRDVNSGSEVDQVEPAVSRSADAPSTPQTVERTGFRTVAPDVRTGSALAVRVDPQRPGLVHPPGYRPPGHRPGVVSPGDARILPTSARLRSSRD